MYARNHWYAAGMSHELGDGLLARTILEEPVLMYRTSDGKVIALEDRCSHRNAPLSLGRRIGDVIQCPYHGLEFGGGGSCTKIPRLDRKPPASYTIRAYPTVERDRYVWLWPGDPALADPALIPDYSWQSQDGWTGTVWLRTIKAGYVFNIENLLDLSHLEYVHAATISTEKFNDAPVITEVHENHVDVFRTMEGVDSDDPEAARYTSGSAAPGGEKVDRQSHVRYIAPSAFWLHTTTYRSGCKDDPDAKINRFGGPNTPETASSHHHFMSTYRNYALDDESLTQLLVDMANTAYSEDIPLLLKQQDRVDAGTYKPIRALPIDKGVLAGIKILERLIERERVEGKDGPVVIAAE
jgi:phenylpropionate dioxygenase-like ring-hydroxylating dioxygenase large terminal subunit